MLIKSLELHNIRSYESQKIEFSLGTTVLSGDIGSGKSTILIALEYALFGLLRGKMQPHELLRHSAKEGYITLHLEIAGYDVKITRGLKRGKNAIAQLSGTISIDGVLEEYVATELKARVLTLLGYPESLLSKSTNLFRYTVYTPQEQVKQILYETIEERKDIIRKIFGIDKYKRVVENTSPYVSDVRERIARMKGRTDDVQILTQQLESMQKELILLEEQKTPLELRYKTAQEQTKREKNNFDKVKIILEEQKKEIHKQQLASQKLLGEKRLIQSFQEQIKPLEERIKALVDEEKEYDVQRKQKIQDVLTSLSQKKLLLNKKYGELTAKESQSKTFQESISHLSTCPTCQQEVTPDHKKHIAHVQEEIIGVVLKKRAEYDILELKIKEKEKTLQEKLLMVLEEEKKHYLFLEQKKQREIDVKRLANLKQSLLEKEQEITHLEKEQLIAKKIKLISVEKEETGYEFARKSEQELALRLREFLTQENALKNQLEQLRKTIIEKSAIEKEITRLTTTRNWVKELFVPLVKNIEKRVLLNIYSEFNTYFILWFSMLIDDESLTVRLDEDFTPLIEQHGFDTTIANLSGGEKTSLALAYRLALNKVLNDYFSSLHTKGLLILDEPTDGFSSQQLDKLRDVLTEIGVKQVIIVSHEQKLESVADHLIQIVKDHQISKIIYT